MEAQPLIDAAGSTFRREMVFERANHDDEKRTFELSFSSELAVDRYGYREVLSHDPADMDLSRLTDGGHPLLLNHDPDKQIGVVEAARIGDDKKGRASVRFSKSPLGEEIWRDVSDGIRRLVSVGYRRTKELTRELVDGLETVRFAWQPYEISVVSVPADASVGIGRTQNVEAERKTPKMEVKEETPKVDVRVAEINAIASALDGKIENVKDMAARAILTDCTVQQFREQLRDTLPAARPTVQIKGPAIEPEATRGYSLLKALKQASTGKLDGIEREVSDEFSRVHGNPKGQFWLPHAAMLRTLEVKTATLGGNLKGTSLMGDEFIEMLRNRMIIGQAGARTLSGLVGDVALPRQRSASTAAWASSELASVSATNLYFDQLSLAPKECIALVSVSNKLMTQSTPSVEALIRSDLTEQIALAIDYAALHGSGSSGQPTGIYSASSNLITVGANGVAFNTFGVTAFASMVSLESALGTSNVNLANCAFITNPKVKAALRQAPLATNQAAFVWSDAGGVGAGDGSILGYRALVTNQVASDRTVGSASGTCSSVFFGDWSQVIMAFWGGGLDILVDPYVNASTRQTNIYATQYADVGLRIPSSIGVLLGVVA